MIMAANTLHREPHAAPESNINPICYDQVMLIQVAPSQSQEAKGSLLLDWEIHEVGCDLPPEKLIVGQILVESPYYPVPVGEGKREEAPCRKVVALAIGIASNIQPMAGPAFPEMHRGKGLVNHTSTPLRKGLLDSGKDLLPKRRWRFQSGDDMPCPAQ